jgi:hypothetical protein
MTQIDSAFADAIRLGDLSLAQDLYDGQKMFVDSEDLDELLWERALAKDQQGLELLRSLGASWPYSTYDFSGALLPPNSVWSTYPNGRAWYLPLGDGHRSLAEFFVSNGAPYESLLSKAVELDDSGAVEFVVSLGVSPDQALLEGAIWGAVDSMPYLIQAAKNVNVRNDKGQTALHICAEPLGAYSWGWDNADQIAQLLIAAGADLNSTDQSGLTPLHMAATSGNLSVAQVLVRAGANLAALNSQGQTSVEVAEDHGYVAIADLLTNISKQPNGESRTLFLTLLFAFGTPLWYTISIFCFVFVFEDLFFGLKPRPRTL